VLETPPRRMTRKQLAAFLQERGYPISRNSIHKAHSQGRGPKPDAKLGKCYLYIPEVGLAWAESLLRPADPAA